MVRDGMDGRVARWTHTASEFGAQYDSIADMVAFGAAPALGAYEWALKDMGTSGWIAAFVYCAATGIRLARFNVNIGVVDKHFFQGLPSPSGAAVLAGVASGGDRLFFPPPNPLLLRRGSRPGAGFPRHPPGSQRPVLHLQEIQLQPSGPDLR